MRPEDNPVGFLILIVQTISTILIWMIANVLLGIYFGFAFFDESPSWKNYLYYLVMLLSLFWLIKYLIKKWKGLA